MTDKILWLCHPQFDLGEWNLYMGLVDVIGLDNIVVFPRKSLYFGQVDNYSGGYPEFLRYMYVGGRNPLPVGIPPLAPGEDVIGGYPNTRELPYLVTVGEHSEFTEDQVIDAIKAESFKYIVLTSSNRVCTIALARIREKVLSSGRGLPPIIYIDNGERDEFNEHWWHVFHPKATFKLILTPEVYNKYKNDKRFGSDGLEIHCLPQSSCLAGKEIRTLLDKYHHMLYLKGVPEWVTFNDYDKIIDVYYAMGGTYGKRSDLAGQIENYSINKKNKIIVGTPAVYYDYMNNIAHSKIAVSMRGSGRDSSRYWDIPTWNTLMVCDGTMGCMHPHPFEDKKTAVFYDENRLDQLPGILDYYLDNDKERRQIAQAGKEWLHKWHTNNARAEHFLEILRRYGL